MFQKKAETVYINAYSGHADMTDLDNFLCSRKDLQKLILVHGELDQMQPLANRVQNVCEGLEIIIPERDQVIEV